MIRNKRRRESLRKSVKVKEKIWKKVPSKGRGLSVRKQPPGAGASENSFEVDTNPGDGERNNPGNRRVPGRRTFPHWNVEGAGILYTEMVEQVLRLYPNIKLDFSSQNRAKASFPPGHLQCPQAYKLFCLSPSWNPLSLPSLSCMPIIYLFAFSR